VFETYCREKIAPLVLRVALGLVAAYHGYLKIIADGGTHWQPGLPTGWQVVLAWGEFVAGLAVLIGLRCRLAALTVLVLSVGLPLWWQGTGLVRQPVRSLEPHFLLFLLSLGLLFLGAGELSLDGRSRGAAASRGAKKE
jgi:uncharacterized membrane protein YphA (DoxX/SURF4 family)